jgi:hypothetical protein
MREIRQSGSEGGATLKTWSLPLSIALSLRDNISQQALAELASKEKTSRRGCRIFSPSDLEHSFSFPNRPRPRISAISHLSSPAPFREEPARRRPRW